MSYMNAIGADEINRRKTIVYNQNLSDDLTVGNKVADNPRVESSVIKDDAAINALINETDADYYNLLELDET